MAVRFEWYYPEGWEWRSKSPNGSLVCGIGHNDADYATGIRVKGNLIRCPAYLRWKDILARCYRLDLETYKDVEVCEAWKTFSNFRHWYFTELSKTPWRPGDFHIDKDILGDGKLYSPDSCLLVPQALNKFITVSRSNCGRYKSGVSFNASRKKFVSQISVQGRQKTLGYFETESLAHEVWLNEKVKMCDTFQLPKHWTRAGSNFVRERLETLIKGVDQCG